MKKSVFAILRLCVIVGVLLVALDALDKSKGKFNLPSRFEKVIVDLSEKARNNELLFTNALDVPSKVEFMLQSDAEGEKEVKIVSEAEILGLKSREANFKVGKFTGNSSISAAFIMGKGSYSVYLTSEKKSGEIAIGHQESAVEISEFERLLKIHKGDLNNPPKGYVEIYSTDLAGRSSNEEVIYTLQLDKNKEIGLSVYTSAKQGIVSVDFSGENVHYIGLVHSEHNRICDQLQTTLPAGEYQIKLTCENADGQLYVFLKE
ncbi:MAG: hypothetical protein GX200_01640 [Firmicutes bacterium]|nr:hypothetical protein [Bacillota bacterium]